MAVSTSHRDASAPLRVAVLGCGGLARQVLLPTFSRLPAVAISAVADSDPAARTAAATLVPGARVCDDWRDAIAPDVDAVVVALPTAMHAEAAVAVIEAGKHLYLEKPIAATLEQGRRVVRLKPNSTVRVGFNYRFNPLIVELRRRVGDGEIGNPRAIRTTFSTKATSGMTWRRPDIPGGGVLLDLGSHHIDLVRYVTGDEIASVRGARTLSSDGAEHVALEIQLAQGAVVQSVFATGADDVDRIEIEGERGSLTVDRYRSWVVREGLRGAGSLSGRLRELSGWRYALEKRRAPWHEPSFARALRAFVAAALGANAEGAGLNDGLRGLEAIDAAERSCVERRTVDVPVAQDVTR